MIKTIIGTIYQSSDGKQFIDETECLEYEKRLEALNNVTFYKVKHDIICAASGKYDKCTYFAISEPTIKGAHFNGLDALEDYCMHNYSYKTYGLFYTDSYCKCTIRRYTKPVKITREEFFSANKEIYEKIYFSDEPITQLDNERVQRIEYASFLR